MSSADANFQQALAKFKKRLTKEEEEDFKFTSLEDVVVEVNNIQTRQGQRKEMMNLPRIKRFLEAMAQYEKIIEVFLNASEMLCFVWGPMKFCLHVREALISQYEQIHANGPSGCKHVGRFVRYPAGCISETRREHSSLRRLSDNF